MTTVVAAKSSCPQDDGMRDDKAPIPKESVRALVEYVVNRHHAYLREAFPRLVQLATELVASHGKSEPRLSQLQISLAAFAEETLQHLDKEERILFPVCIGLENGRRPGMPPSVRMPIQRMLQEHEGHIAELERLSFLTDNYAARGDFGPKHRELVEGLRELEADLRQHIETENEHLFPWALRLEAALP